MKLPDPQRPVEAQDEEVLLAMCVWGEARGECPEAQLGVANAVRNRVVLGRFGSGWRGVILKRWQFSSFNPADPNRPKLMRPLEYDSPAVWKSCCEAALSVMAGQARDNTYGATHYYDDSIDAPGWASFYPFTAKLGNLNFHRWTSSGDAAAALDRKSRQNQLAA